MSWAPIDQATLSVAEDAAAQASGGHDGLRPNPAALPAAFAIGAAMCLAVCAQAVLVGAKRPPLAVALFLAAAWLIVWGSRDEPPLAPRSEPARVAAPAGNAWRGAALAAAALAAAALALFERGAALDLAWLAWAASLAATCAAACLAGGRSILGVRWRADGPHLVALGALLAAGFAIRVLWLDHVPFGFWFDEAFGALQVQRIVHEPGYRPVFVGTPGQGPALSWYITVPWFWLFGAGPLAMRLTPAIGGTLGILAIYLVGRELFGRAAGLIAAAIMTTFAWQVTFSRITFSSLWSVTLDAFALYFLVRAVRRGSYASAALCGLCLGLGLWMYYTSRVMAVVLVLAAPFLYGARVRRHARSFALLGASAVAVAVLAFSPVLQFAAGHPDQFNGRLGEVSVFKEVRDQASFEPIASNVERHVLMFNWEGDRNGRHNLPDAPELNVVLAGLFVLGLGVALARLRAPEYRLLVAWAVLMLLPGVLSVSFEAPQTSRTMDEINPAVLVATLPLALLVRAASRARAPEVPVANARRGRAAATAVVALAVLASGVVDVHRYFAVQQRDPRVVSDSSGAATLLAREANRLPDGAAVFVDENLVGDPTVQFLAPRLHDPTPFALWRLPLRDPRLTAIFLEGDATDALGAVTQMYPQATVTKLTSPYGGPTLLDEVVVPAALVAAPMGVQLEETPAGTAGPASMRRPDVSLPQEQPAASFPVRARWTASLLAPQFGDYAFRLVGPQGATATIDRRQVIPAGRDLLLTLARGLHTLEVDATVGAEAPVQLLWRPPGSREFAAVPHDALFTDSVSTNGLLGRYFPNRTWSSPVAYEQIDPFVSFRYHLLPLPPPFSVEWAGKLIAPLDGVYAFGTTSIDSSQVEVDGRRVVDNTTPNAYVEGRVALGRGLHDLRVRYEAHTGFNHVELYWQPPGRERQVVPQASLLPAAPAGDEGAAVPAEAAPTPPTVELKVAAVIDLAGALGPSSTPEGVAADRAGNVYVADSGLRALVKLNASGAVVWTATSKAGSDLLADPVAVAVLGDGTLLVLDAEDGWIVRYSPDGRALGKIGGPSVRLYHPRGMAVAADGAIYVADTGGSRLVKLDASGTVVGTFGSRGEGRGGLDQPTGVAVTASGDPIALDPSLGKLMRFAPSGGAERAWLFDNGDTVHGPQLAVAPDGSLLATDPRAGTISRYTQDGAAQAIYTASTGLPGVSGVALGDGYVVVSLPGAHKVEKLTLP